MKGKKLITRLAVATLLFGAVPIAFTGSMDTVVAASETPALGGNTIADETTMRAITIHKYQIDDTSQLGNRGDGTELPAADVQDLVPLAGINFTIQKVTPVDGGPALDSPIGLTAGTDYQLDGTAVTVTTGADGSITHEFGTGTAADGIYLVTEQDDPRVAKVADPFFVHVPMTKRGTDAQGELIYDIHVYPKNILQASIDPVKTIEGSANNSIQAGVPFDWEATVNIPSGLHQIASQDMKITPVYNESGEQVADMDVAAGEAIYANYFRFTDTLQQQLLLDDVKMQIGDSVTGTWTDLVFGTDYTVTVDNNQVATSPVVSTTDAAKVVVAELTQAGMEKVAAALVATDTTHRDLIRVVYTTHVALDWDIEIANSFDVAFLSPGLKPIDTGTDPNDPTRLYNGTISVLKVSDQTDAEGTPETLAGAEFHIAETEANAENQIFLASDGNSYREADLPEGVTFLSSVTEADGLAYFTGLALDWFTDDNGNNIQDEGETTWLDKDIVREYYLVETKAPDGYELWNGVLTVTARYIANGAIEGTVLNRSQTSLPFTGGNGRLLLVSLAIGAITIGAIAIVIDKRRRQA